MHFETTLIGRIDGLNNLLVPYGRVLLPLWMSAGVLEFIERVAVNLQSSDPTLRDNTLNVIDTFIARDGFHPTIRAFQCYRSAEVPGIQEYSNHLERATMHYYRRDYLSALKVMVPLVEGVALRLMQAPVTQHVTHKDLIRFVRGLAANPQNDPAYSLDHRLQPRFIVFRDLLCDLLESRFFRRDADAHSGGQFNFSLLNRHFILHQLDTTPFDNLHECQSMFQLYDLFLETIACQTGVSCSYSLVPDDERIRLPALLYWSLVLRDYFQVDDESLVLGAQPSPLDRGQSIDTNWLALMGSPYDDKEVLMVAHGLEKVRPEIIATIVANLRNLGIKRQQVFWQAMEVIGFVRSAERDEVARNAYELWVRRGYAHGDDLRDWFQAEKIVKRKYSR